MNISDGFRGSWRRVRKSWRQLTVIHRVAVSVGDDSWDCGACWAKLGIVSASGKQGVCNLMEIVGASISVGDIWSILQSGGNNHVAVSVATAAGRMN